MTLLNMVVRGRKTEPRRVGHAEAIDLISGCARTVTVLSYEEAIRAYFSLRGISLPRDYPPLAPAKATGQAVSQ